MKFRLKSEDKKLLFLRLRERIHHSTFKILFLKRQKVESVVFSELGIYLRYLKAHFNLDNMHTFQAHIKLETYHTLFHAPFLKSGRSLSQLLFSHKGIFH